MLDIAWEVVMGVGLVLGAFGLVGLAMAAIGAVLAVARASVE